MVKAKRVTSKVIKFMKNRGFGHIEPAGKADEKIFVHWKEIQTDDRWPSLEKDMVVEFSLEQEEGKGKKPGMWKAINVTRKGGKKINTAAKEKFISGGKKFKGVVDWYNNRKGSGMIKVNGKIPGVKLEEGKLHVERSDIISNDEPPLLVKGESVEFKVVKTDKGAAARVVTGPKGAKIHHPEKAGNKKKKVSKKKTSNTKKKAMKRTKAQKGRGRKRGGNRKTSAMGYFGVGGMPKNEYQWEYDPEAGVEIGLMIPKKYVGALIGKKGAKIKSMKKKTGATIQFGDDDVSYNGTPNNVCALSGTGDSVTKCVQEIAKIIANTAQSLDHKIMFLVPEQFCGTLIGKKGANIKKIIGADKPRKDQVQVRVTDDAIQLPGTSSVNVCSVFGGQKNVARAVEDTVESLGMISQRVLYEQRKKEQQAMMKFMGLGMRARGMAF